MSKQGHGQASLQEEAGSKGGAPGGGLDKGYPHFRMLPGSTRRHHPGSVECTRRGPTGQEEQSLPCKTRRCSELGPTRSWKPEDRRRGWGCRLLSR
jgi:hypothetical protein